MLDQITQWSSEIKLLSPWAFFLAGLAGSLHCVGMCGGLVAASCSKSQDTLIYQLGRLLGYLSLAFLFGWLGESLQYTLRHSSWFSLIPTILMGGMFIIWGLQILLNKKFHLPGSKYLSKLYSYLWSKWRGSNLPINRALMTGLLSIFLPCGLLYGILIASIGLENRWSSLLAIGLFWVGTLPGMIFAPTLLRRIFLPLKSYLPKLYSISLITIGVLTVSMRFINLQKSTLEKHSNHHSQNTKPSCH